MLCCCFLPHVPCYKYDVIGEEAYWVSMLVLEILQALGINVPHCAAGVRLRVGS